MPVRAVTEAVRPVPPVVTGEVAVMVGVTGAGGGGGGSVDPLAVKV